MDFHPKKGQSSAPPNPCFLAVVGEVVLYPNSISQDHSFINGVGKSWMSFKHAHKCNLSRRHLQKMFILGALHSFPPTQPRFILTTPWFSLIKWDLFFLFNSMSSVRRVCALVTFFAIGTLFLGLLFWKNPTLGLGRGRGECRRRERREAGRKEKHHPHHTSSLWPSTSPGGHGNHKVISEAPELSNHPRSLKNANVCKWIA